MRWVLLVIAVLVSVALIIIFIGALLPRDHVSTRSARYRRSPQELWNAMTDYRKFPEWRKGIRNVEPLPAADGKASWNETDAQGNVIPYEVVESIPAKRLVTKIANPKLPFGGTWTYDLDGEPDGSTILRITENGEIYNPIFRFVARYFMGYAQTQEQYLRDLGTKFGEAVTVER